MAKHSTIPGVLLRRSASWFGLVSSWYAVSWLYRPGAPSLKRARLPQATPTIA